MTDNNKTFGGFDVLADMFSAADKTISKVNDDKKKKVDDDDVNDDDDAKVNDDDDSQVPNLDDDNNDDNSDDKTNNNDDNNDDEPSDITHLDEAEPEISSYFASILADKLGLDIDEKQKFESTDDVIDLMTNIIKENSKPEYANEEIAKYDQYIRNGGNLKTFYDEIYKDSVNVEDLDLEDEVDQKKAIEANLKNLGYKEDRIKKVINRYEAAEVLRDEAEDAIEAIKDYQDKQSKKLLVEQENAKIESEKQNKKFFSDVNSYINSLKDISGAPLGEADKKELINYIFKTDPTGSTGFQKDYASNSIKNLVETAYFINPKYRGTLLNKTSKKATDDAMKKVREKLNASKGKRNTGSSSGLGKGSLNFSSLSGLITK